MSGPNTSTVHPLTEHPRIVFLKNVISRPNIIVGDYSYYDDPTAAETFEDNNVLYHFDFLGDQLVIGKFVAIATGATFIMNGANHLMDGYSTYPFHVFGNGWEAGFDPQAYLSKSRGDTVIGHDVWIGNNARFMPGVKVGNGAIIGTSTVVASDVPAYAIVVGNPGRVLRKRFDPQTIAALESICWWDWPSDKIARNLNVLRNADLAALKAIE
jgi:virginiamycin A acetyltransferase